MVQILMIQILDLKVGDFSNSQMVRSPEEHLLNVGASYELNRQINLNLNLIMTHRDYGNVNAAGKMVEI